MGIIDALQKILSSDIPNIQLDFFRANGQVLFQVYKQKDVSTWKNNFVLTDENGLILEILFHKNKTNNSKNLKRFLKSSLNDSLKRIDKINQNSYFYGINSQENTSEIVDKLLLILNEVFELSESELKKTYLTLNAY